MISILVTYEVKPDFAEQNKQNIAAVMAELRSENNENIRYASYMEEDGVTFMHFVQFRDEASKPGLQSLDFFKSFQQALKASDPVKRPVSTNYNLVASGHDIFN